jgi:hypothetical protein
MNQYVVIRTPRRIAKVPLSGRPFRAENGPAAARWLCKVAERQMLRPSFVPPHEIRRLRDLTRYRVDLVGVRTAEPGRHFRRR